MQVLYNDITYCVHDQHGVFGDELSAVGEVLGALMRGTEPEWVARTLDLL